MKFTPEQDRVAKADKEISRILKKYNVEFRDDVACDIWLRGKEIKEPAKPGLKLVH